MTFKMNDRTWEIEEASADWLLEEYKKECGDATYCFGLCRYSKQKIYLNKELHPDQKRQTLMHELMHCYIWSYVCGFEKLGEEGVCDISANSHNIIHKIVEDYFNKTITTLEDPRFTYLSDLKSGKLDKRLEIC